MFESFDLSPLILLNANIFAFASIRSSYPTQTNDSNLYPLQFSLLITYLKPSLWVDLCKRKVELVGKYTYNCQLVL